jgi:hypothetical protein
VTCEEFFKELRKVREAGFQPYFRGARLAIRLLQPGEVEMPIRCPITAVCVFNTGKSYGESAFDAAAAVLDMDMVAAKFIARATDNDYGYLDPGDEQKVSELRRTLLMVLNIYEQ